MIWWIGAGIFYIIVQAAICLFFKGAAILNKKTVVFDNASSMDKRGFTVILCDEPEPALMGKPLPNAQH